MGEPVEQRAGTASGINNAVARVAGVLGIAVLGIVMVLAFRARLDHGLNHLSLPTGALLEIHAQQSRLADLQSPASLDPSTRTAIADLTRQGFVSGFRIVMAICAGLSSAGALVALIMVPRAGESRFGGFSSY